MNQECRGLFTIGSFATATRLSLKALRLYNQLGLLMPRYVDPETGYRYYHADQLDHGRLIRMLRAMEMPLAAIRQVLAATSLPRVSFEDDEVAAFAGPYEDELGKHGIVAQRIGQGQEAIVGNPKHCTAGTDIPRRVRCLS